MVRAAFLEANVRRGFSMGRAAPACAAPLIESVPVEDIFVTGLGMIEQRGDFIRMIFFAEGPVFDGSQCGPPDIRAVRARLVCTEDRLRRMLRQIRHALGDI